MKCPSCRHANRDRNKYCTRCGAPLARICLNCHTPAMPEDLFCGGCGQSLSSQNQQTQSLLGHSPLPGAQPAVLAEKGKPSFASERKNVTVLFADISGFTALSERLDSEVITQIMNSCLKMMSDVVLKFEGYIDKFIGDCIMAIFGAPVTHENDPELAIRAALEMLKAMPEFNKSLTVELDKPLTLHIGINTGVVIAGGVGPDDKMAYTVMGDTVNLASRLESIAGDSQIFISSYTYNLTREMFEFISHDKIKVKGKKDPVTVYEVVRVRSGKGRPGKETDFVIPLVGRKKEFTVLKEGLAELLKGHGHVVFLTSGPGMGKSRIQVEISKQFSREVQIFEGVCRSFSRSTSYGPFADIFRNFFSIDSEDLTELVTDKITDAVPALLDMDIGDLSGDAKEAIVFIGNILGVRLGDRFGIDMDQMDAQEVKASSFNAVRWFFKKMAEKKPVLIILENLHSADNTSLELISFLMESLADAPLMLLILMRTNSEHPSAKLPQMAQRRLHERAREIAISHLTPSECREFIRHLLKSDDVPADFSGFIIERSGGNPLYIEEIIRSLVADNTIERTKDNGIKIARALDKISIPDSIHGLLTARIDNLPGDLKDLLLTLAVMGLQFKHALVQRVLPPDTDIEQRLSRLMDTRLILKSQVYPEVQYSFRNMLTQEAAYSILLHGKRKTIHAAVADAIEAIYEGRIEDHFEELAMHYGRAEDYEKACQYMIKSGMKAKMAFANEEAAGFFLQAIGLATEKCLPINVADLYIALSEVKELLGDMDGAIAAWKIVEKMAEADLQKGDALRNIGRLQDKQGVKEKAVCTYEKAFDHLKQYPDAVETGMLMMNQSWVLNRMREHEKALEKATGALKIFEMHNDRKHTAYVYNNIAVIFESKGDLQQALKYNQRSLRLFTELGNKRYIANLYLSTGFVLNKMNDNEGALDYFNKSLELMDMVGNRFGKGTVYLAQGRTYLDLDRLEEAETGLIHALNIHRDLNLDRKIVANHLSLVKVFIRKKDALSAKKHLEAGRRIARENNYISSLARYAHSAAHVAMVEGRTPDAHFQEAIDLFNRIGRSRDALKIEKEFESYK